MKIPKEARPDIMAMYRRGVSYKDIADKYGTTPQGIGYIVRTLIERNDPLAQGLTMRKPQGKSQASSQPKPKPKDQPQPSKPQAVKEPRGTRQHEPEVELFDEPDVEEQPIVEARGEYGDTARLMATATRVSEGFEKWLRTKNSTDAKLLASSLSRLRDEINAIELELSL